MEETSDRIKPVASSSSSRKLKVEELCVLKPTDGGDGTALLEGEGRDNM